MPRFRWPGTVSPSPAPIHRLEPESFPFPGLTDNPLFYSHPKPFGAVTALPLLPVFTHESDDSVAHLKEALLQDGMLRGRDLLAGDELNRRLNRDRNRLQ